MPDSVPSSTLAAGFQGTNSPVPRICKEKRIEESEIKKILERKHPHKIEPYIPPGRKLARPNSESASPKVLESELTSAANEPNVREARKFSQKTTVGVAPTEYPYTTVGVLFVGSGLDFSTPTGRGTAVVVGLNNMILTAATVIPWSAPGGFWARFVPGYLDGDEPFGSAYAVRWFGYYSSPVLTATDYLVLELDSPIGEKCGWMGAYSTTDNHAYLANQNWNTVGYPAEAPVEGLDILIERDDDSSLNLKRFYAQDLFDSTKEPGWYGAPMYGSVDGEEPGPYVIAVLVGNFYYDADEGNYMMYAGGPELLAVIEWGMANFS